MAKVIDTVADCKLLFNSPVKNESALILLRSRLRAITQRMGFPERKQENMLLVASEMVSNQLKHAAGCGLIQLWQQPGPVLDMLALDYGPGIANLERAQRDGYSSVNTLGKGLGSISRLSDDSYIYTQPANASGVKKWNGAVFLARFYPPNTVFEGLMPPKFEVGLFSRSLSDDRYNGDRIYMHHDNGKLRWLHLDGLGHGEHAQAATANLGAHLAHCDTSDALLTAIDRQLKETRGAVAIATEFNLHGRSLNILGVGDMHAHLMDQDEMKNLSFSPGILGKEHKKTLPFRLDYSKNSLIISCSDGIRRNWEASSFNGLFQQHPQMIAYTLGNIMCRISDDQSVCVVRTD